ncbi:MAG: hypothetical protein WBA84_02135 [Carnobacterium sp.]
MLCFFELLSGLTTGLVVISAIFTSRILCTTTINKMMVNPYAVNQGFTTAPTNADIAVPIQEKLFKQRAPY